MVEQKLPKLPATAEIRHPLSKTRTKLADWIQSVSFSRQITFGSSEAKMAVHFVGFRGDEYASAVRVWGKPDFIHRGPHDQPYADRNFDDIQETQA